MIRVDCDLRLMLVAAIPMRFQRTRRVVNFVMKFRLSDFSCVCLLMAHNEQLMDDILAEWIMIFTSQGYHPLSLLTVILRKQTSEYSSWLYGLRIQVTDLETSTGMTRENLMQPLSEEYKKWLSNYDILLPQMHGVNTELSHCKTVRSAIIKLCNFTLGMFDLVEHHRLAQGCQSFSLRQPIKSQEELHFIKTRVDFSGDKLDEMLNRIKAQIEVVCQSYSVQVSLN
jgi:hypothetical protein